MQLTVQINHLGPDDIQEMLMEYKTARVLQLGDSGQFVEPRFQRKQGEVVFGCDAACKWNTLSTKPQV